MRTSSGTVNVNYLFDSAGRWIAFRKRRYVFDKESRWIGWTPWDDNEVYAPNGTYLGTITYGNRLYCYRQRQERPAPPVIEAPPFPGTYSEPASPGRAVLLPWASDLDFCWHAEMDWSSDLGVDVEQKLYNETSECVATDKSSSSNNANSFVLDLDDELSSGTPNVIVGLMSNNKPATRTPSSRDDDGYYDERDRRPSRPRSRYDDDDYYDDRDRRPSRPRSRYDDDDYYDDRDRRPSRPRSRYDDDDYYDDRDRRPSRPRSRYDDDDYYDDRDRRPSRPRSRYDDDDYYDDRDRRPSRPRSRYDDDDNDRAERRVRDEYHDRAFSSDRSRHSEREYEDHYLHHDDEMYSSRDKDGSFSRKQEMERLRVVISSHNKKSSTTDETLLQPLKKIN